MHCVCCDKILNDFESTRKSKTTGEYLDMCNRCYTTVAEDIPVVNRDNLEPYEIPDDILMEEEDNLLSDDDD